MNWKALGTVLAFFWTVFVVILKVLLQAGTTSGRKKPARYSSLVSRELYEKGEISQDDYLRSLEAD